MTKYRILFVLLILNMLTALGYMIVMGIRGERGRGILVGFQMILVPVAGPLFVYLSYMFFLILKCSDVAYIDPEEISFRKKKIRVIEGDSLERGINKVPIEEALLESDSGIVRQVLLDVLKSDFEGSISILVKAMESDDSEVSHYASTAISDVLSKFKVHQKELDEQYRSHLNDEKILTAYRRYVYRYLSYHIFPKTEEIRYMNLYSELMENAYVHFPNIDVQDYENWINFLVDKGEREQAEGWLLRMQREHPGCLSTYRAQMKFCYQYDHRKFGTCLQRIRNSQIMLDEHTLEVVRFFQYA